MPCSAPNKIWLEAGGGQLQLEVGGGEIVREFSRLNCRFDCGWVFDRVVVFPSTVGGSRVEWSLHPLFRDPGPFVFQLQVGRTDNPQADDWTDVGSPVTDTFYAIDPAQRVWAMTQWTHYRLLLTTGLGSYASAPQNALGALSRQDWTKWKNHVRMWSLKLQKGPGSSLGYLLKRRLYGAPCSCVDPLTGEVRRPQDPVCFGTGWVGGYFAPIPCIWADLALKLTRDHLDPSRGNVNELNVAAKLLAVPQLYEKDVFVEKKTDIRYSVHGIEYLVAQNGVPAAVSVKLIPFPFDHVIYQYPIADLTN